MKIDQITLKNLSAFYKEQLYQNTLPFWLSHGFDKIHGGFYTGLGRDGTLLESDKSVWFQGRASWTFATAYRYAPDHGSDYLSAVESAIQFSDTYCYDHPGRNQIDGDGRMFFRVTKDGNPVIKRRYFFSECFAALGKAAYSLALKSPDMLEDSFRLYRKIIDYQSDPTIQRPKYNPVHRPMIGLGLPMIEIHLAQEIREASDLILGNTSQISQFCSQRILNRIHFVQSNLIKDDLQLVLEQAGPKGAFLSDHFDGRLINPGHSIEFAWFVLREAEYSSSKELQRLGTKILSWMLTKGWDQEYGGLFYFLDALGHPAHEYWHDMKFWWPHNEAVIGCLYAALLAEQTEERNNYLEWFYRIHQWNQDHFPDPEYGEWFGYLHRNGSVSTQLKGNLFKGPYHIPRMQIYGWQLLDRIAQQI